MSDSDSTSGTDSKERGSDAGKNKGPESIAPEALDKDASNRAAADRTDYRIVDNDQALSLMVDACLLQAAIALDTEFIRTDTFYPKPALLQIYDGRQIYLIDPLAINDFEPLRELFKSPDTIKVMHSCSEDMEVFSRLLDCYPTPLVDSQIAASLAGMDFSISYQRLVEAILAKPLDKGETRSDWLQRPLSDNQLSYAADDVLWLLDVYHVLMDQLSVLGREAWLREECDELLIRARQPIPFDQYYLKIKAAWRLDPRSLNVLRGLCAWREREARENNVPRSRIVSDTALLELSRARPQDKSSLSPIADMRHSTIRSHGAAIIDEINSTDNVGSNAYPQALQPKNHLLVRQTLKKMKQASSTAAAELKIPEGLLARKRDLEAYLFATDRGDELLGSGWRGDILVERFAPIIADYIASDNDNAG